MEARLLSKDGTHFWVELDHPEGELLPDAVAKLRVLGWQTDEERGLREAPPLDGVATTHLNKRGSALFGGMTEDEARDALAEVERILEEEGIPIAEKRQVDPMELM